MKTIFKNKLLIGAMFALMACSSAIGVYAFTNNVLPTANAEAAQTENAQTNTPNPSVTLSIESNNVSYSDSIYILYAVSNDGFDRAQYPIQMLFWDEVSETYAYGTQDYVATDKGTKTINGKNCLVFQSAGLAAKKMTTDVFARAYTEIDGVAYYSDVTKFSVLEYVYTMREKGDLTPEREALFDNMLDYGGAAQNNFKYETDRLANDTYYKIDIDGGHHDDGFDHGRYKPGDHCTIHPGEPPEGKHFSHWEDKDGNIVSTKPDFDFVVGDKDCSFKPIFKDDNEKGTSVTLSAEIDYDGAVEEIGLPDTVSFVYDGETVALGVSWTTDYFVKSQIGVQTLYATLNDLQAYQTYNIEESGICCNVTTLPYTLSQSSGGAYRIDGYYGEDETLVLPDTYKNVTVATVGNYAFDDKDG